MAKPTLYPDWANSDINLPGTGKTNKVQPREVIRTTGWDKGQIPTAEELNWTLNNIGQWVHYLVDEFIPTLPNTYLGKTGTSFTLTGGATGTISWTGTSQGTGNIKITDNSHNHLSANITDATPNYAPNMIVKRGASGEATFGDVVSMATTVTDSATYFLQDLQGANIGDISVGQGDGGVMYVRKLNRATGGAQGAIAIRSDNVVEMTNPRSTTNQEGVGEALVRYDFLVTQLNSVGNNISNVNNDLQAWKQNTNNNFVTTLRLSGRTAFVCRSGTLNFPTGCVMTGCGDFGSDDGYGNYSAIQYYVPGQGWLTAQGPE